MQQVSPIWSVTTALSQGFWSSLNSNAAAVQAAIAVIALLVALCLAYVTVTSARRAHDALQVPQRKAAASLRPQVLPSIQERARADGTIECTVAIKNAGDYYFKIVSVGYGVFRRAAPGQSEWGGESSITDLQLRIVGAGDTVSAQFSVVPMAHSRQEPHDGPGNWILDFYICVEDLFGHNRHSFYFDNRLGLKGPPMVQTPVPNRRFAKQEYWAWKQKDAVKSKLHERWRRVKDVFQRG